jgi:DedD protein
MNATEDTEITLGMGRVLALFFSLVALCAVFFGLGYRMGRSSPAGAASDQLPIAQSNNGIRPSAARTPAAAAETKAFQTADQPGADEPPPSTTANHSSGSAASAPTAAASSSSSSPSGAGGALESVANYFVQVAAVSKQEDADALVDALKRKQYVAAATPGPTDKLFHVQVGPFSDIKDAESMRTRLMNDGYNPILKK